MIARVLIQDIGSELRIILEQAAKDTRRQGLEELNQIRMRLAGMTFDDSTELLREDRYR